MLAYIRKDALLFSAFLVLSLLCLLDFVFVGLELSWALYYDAVLLSILPVATGLLGLVLWYTYAPGEPLRPVWLLLGLGLMLLGIGVLIFSIQWAFLDYVPEDGLADIFWAVGITLLMVGVVLRALRMGIRFQPLHLAISIGVGMLGLVTVLAISVPQAIAGGRLIDWAGPYNLAADVILAATCLLIILTYSPGALFSKAWNWLLAGAALYVLIDLAFFTARITGQAIGLDADHVIIVVLTGPGYAAAYLLVTMGILIQMHLDRDLIAERFRLPAAATS